MAWKNLAHPRFWVAGLVFLVLVFLIFIFVQGWILPAPESSVQILNNSDEHLNKISGYIAAQITAVDHILYNLMTLQIGIFVLVGFVIQKFKRYETHIPGAETIFGVLFLIFSFISIYFAYVARVQVFELVKAVRIDFKDLQVFIGWHALFLSAAGVCAICLTTLALVGPPKSSDADDSATEDGCREEQCLSDEAKAKILKILGFGKGRARLTLSLCVALSFSFLIFSNSATRARPCNSDEVTNAESKLPKILLVKPGQTPKSAINSVLGCEYPFFSVIIFNVKPTAERLIGRQIEDATKRPVGKIYDLIIGKDYRLKSVVVSLIEFGDKKVTVPASALQWRIVGIHTPSLYAEDFSKLPEYRREFPAPDFAAIMGKSDLSFKNVVTASGRSPRGLYPLSLVAVMMESKPAGADILFESNSIGTTTVIATMYENQLKEIKFRKAGFATCAFKDAEYKPSYGHNADYLLHCDLVPESKKSNQKK